MVHSLLRKNGGGVLPLMSELRSGEIDLAKGQQHASNRLWLYMWHDTDRMFEGRNPLLSASPFYHCCGKRSCCSDVPFIQRTGMETRERRFSRDSGTRTPSFILPRWPRLHKYYRASCGAEGARGERFGKGKVSSAASKLVRR